MKTLKLFNAVLYKETNEKPLVSEKGYIIEAGALWAKKEIEQFLKNEKLDGYGLNKTFHKSWLKIFKSSRVELMMEQIRHYISTYGSNFEDEIYIPNEILDVPDQKVCFKVIKAYSKKEMTQKCLSLLQSGIALKKETIEELISVLVHELSYQFTGEEKIRNKEANMIIADICGILPTDVVEFLRFILFKTSGETLLIKNKETIDSIKKSDYNPAKAFEKFGLEKLAEVFNRFKPLFLAFKNKCPQTINKLSKLSKTYHKPLVINPLNCATFLLLTKEDVHWLDHATPFAIFKALSACYSRMLGQDTFTYRIRNGKSFVKANKVVNVVKTNFYFLLNYCKTRFPLYGKQFYIPEDVEYALPTSEKMFVGNIPTGSKFYAESLAVGVYWENAWGAHDMDLSGLNIAGKIGWNAQYKQGKGDLMYSGDITDAPDGAVEYLYAQNGLSVPTLVLNNVFSGNGDAEYKIIVGRGDEIHYNYMMDPNKLFLEAKCASIQKQMVLGMMIPENEKVSFVILNFGAGASRVSGNSKVTIEATKALFQQWKNPYTLNYFILEMGGELVSKPSEADYNLALETLQKDSFTKIFEGV